MHKSMSDEMFRNLIRDRLQAGAKVEEIRSELAGYGLTPAKINELAGQIKERDEAIKHQQSTLVRVADWTPVIAGVALLTGVAGAGVILPREDFARCCFFGGLLTFFACSGFVAWIWRMQRWAWLMGIQTDVVMDRFKFIYVLMAIGAALAILGACVDPSVIPMRNPIRVRRGSYAIPPGPAERWLHGAEIPTAADQPSPGCLPG